MYWGGGPEEGSDTHIRAVVWDRGEAFDAGGVQQLTCDSLNGMRTTQNLAAALPTWTGFESPECTVARSWTVGIGEQSQGEIC